MQHIDCPQCGHRLKYPDEYAGKKAKCKKCAQSLRLPALTRPPAMKLIQDEVELVPLQDAAPIQDGRERLEALKAEIIEAVPSAMDSGNPILGPRLKGAARAAGLVRAVTAIMNDIDTAEEGNKIAKAEMWLTSLRGMKSNAGAARSQAAWKVAGTVLAVCVVGIIALALGALRGLAESGSISPWFGVVAFVGIVAMYFILD